MTAVLDAPADLTGLTDDELTAMYATADDATIAALTAECDRRDRAARAAAGRVAASRKYEALRLEWYENCAYPEFLQAQAYCGGGKMLSLLGERNTDEPSVLWTGSEEDAQAWASEELKAWWLDHPRTTFRTWLRQRARGLRAQREDAMEKTGGRMETEQAAAPAPDRFADPAAWRAKSAKRRADINETARQAGIRPGGQVATRDPDAIEPSAIRAPGRRERPDAADLLRQVLEQIGLYVCKYVQFPSAAAVVAVVLWIAHAAARDGEGKLIFRASPRLLLTSSENGSGKSTLMDLIALLLLSRVGRLVKVTAAGMAGILNELHDVALPDDAQLTFGATGAAAKDIQAVILGSYSKKGSWVTGKQTVTVKPVYGPVVVAGKDELITVQRDKLKDLLARSVIIRMKRPATYMPQIDDDADARGTDLGTALKAVMGALEDQIKQAVRDLDAEAAGQQITEGDGGRTAQIFRQLQAVARIAGGMWPQAMDDAAEELVAASGDLISVEDILKSLDDQQEAAGGTAGGSFWEQIGEMNA